MHEVELSTMVRGDCLNLPALEQQWFIRARHRQFDWVTGWNDILQIGLYQKGPDVSEVGSTWLENLNDMRALRPFTISEINALGGEHAFLQNTWAVAAGDSGRPRPIAIPWILDTRLVYYRRDLLAKAGIAEAGAFCTPGAFVDTLKRLQSAGIAYPLALPTSGLSIHNLASWVWGRGGHFRTDDYRKIALVETEARSGLVDYFRLHEFIDPLAQGQVYESANDVYMHGEAAVLMSGQWLMHTLKARPEGVLPEVLDHTGYAPPPGVPFVGAAHLVIWRHSLHESDSLQTIIHLNSPHVLADVWTATGNFPARITALSGPPFSTDPDYQMAVECLRRGRGFRSAHLWAGVEMRLNALFQQLWNDLFAQPDLDIEAEIERRVGDLAARLEKTLLANW